MAPETVRMVLVEGDAGHRVVAPAQAAPAPAPAAPAPAPAAPAPAPEANVPASRSAGPGACARFGSDSRGAGGRCLLPPVIAPIPGATPLPIPGMGGPPGGGFGPGRELGPVAAVTAVASSPGSPVVEATVAFSS